MPLPPDIQQRVAKAQASGFSPEQIRADIKRKYGEDYAVAAPTPAPKKTIAEKIGGFLGISNFGKGLGVALATGSGDVKAAKASQEQARQTAQKAAQAARKYSAGDPRREALLRASGGVQKTISAGSEAAAGVEDAPTAKQFLASAAATALNIGGAGTIGGKTAAGGALKAGQMAGKLAEQPLRGAILQSAIQGGGMTAANKWGEGGNAGEVMKAGAGGAAMGAATTGTLGLLGKLARHGTTTAPENIYKISTQMKRGENAMPLVKAGVTGGEDELLRKAGSYLDNAETAIASNPQAKTMVNRSQTLRNKALAKLLEQAGEPGDPEYDAVKSVVERKLLNKPVTATAGELLKENRALQRFTSNNAFQTPTVQAGTSAKVALANANREVLRDQAPAVAKLVNDEQPYIQLQGAIERMKGLRDSFPGMGGQFLQRTLLKPALGTRAARALYLSGAPARALAKGPINDAVRRALKALLVSGEANGVTGQ